MFRLLCLRQSECCCVVLNLHWDSVILNKLKDTFMMWLEILVLYMSILCLGRYDAVKQISKGLPVGND